MALKWIEGFETFVDATGGDLLPGIREKCIINGTSSFVSNTGRFGYDISAFFAPNLDTTSPPNSAFVLTPPLASTTGSQTVWTIGMAIRIPALPAGTVDLLRVLLNATQQCAVRLNTSGNLLIVGGSTSMSTSPFAIAIQTWYYLEFKVDVKNSGGSFELRIDDTVRKSGSGLDIADSASDGANYFAFHLSTALDDIYICDNVGAINTSFLGQRTSVKLFVPTEDGSVNDWVNTGGGNNFEDIDDRNTPTDADLVKTSTASAIDLYKYSRADNKAFDLASIYGIQENIFHRKSEVGSRSIRGIVKADVSGTPTTATSEILGAADNYTNDIYIVETNPDTSSSWVRNDFLNTEFGIKLES